jgi:hypothetical protein
VQRGARRQSGRRVARLGFLTLTVVLAAAYLHGGSLRRMGEQPWTRGRRTFYGQLDHHRRGGRGTPASAAGTAASSIIVVRRRPRARLPAMWMESGVAISGQGQPESARNNGEWAHQGRGARHHYDGEDSFLLALGMMGLIAVDEYDRR